MQVHRLLGTSLALCFASLSAAAATFTVTNANDSGTGSLRQAVTPDRLLGRVTATMICLTVATAPLGGLIGGWIAEHQGLRAAMLFAGVGALLLAPVVTWLSPLAKMRELPGPQEPAATESVAEEMAGD